MLRGFPDVPDFHTYVVSREDVVLVTPREDCARNRVNNVGKEMLLAGVFIKLENRRAGFIFAISSQITQKDASFGLRKQKLVRTSRVKFGVCDDLFQLVNIGRFEVHHVITLD